MKNKTKQNFYLYYLIENSDSKFLYTVRNCKRPEQTKEYKKLKVWLYKDIVQSIGWCDQGYFEDYKPKFTNSDLKIKAINLKK